VPTVDAAGVTGINIVVVLLGAVFDKGPGFVQVTTCPLVVQVLPFVTNGPAGAEKPVGNVTVVVIGPFASAVP
jgi:hypothetical protein